MTLQRLRYNFIAGSVTNITTTGASGVITFSNVNGLGNVTVTNGTQYLPLTINPPSYSSSAPAEVVWVTSYTANSSTANVLRAQEGTSNGGTWTGATYTHGPTTLDFDVSNLTSNGQLTLGSGLVVNNLTTTSGLSVTNNASIGGTLTANTISSNTDTNTYNLTTGTLTVNSFGTVPTPAQGDNSTKIASTAFVTTAISSGTGTFTNSISTGTLQTASSQLMTLTVSGFNKYLIDANLTAGNNDTGSGHFVYFQISNQTANTFSQTMSSYATASQRVYVGSSYIVTGVGTGPQNIQLLGYIGGSVTGTVVTLTANAIGLT